MAVAMTVAVSFPLPLNLVNFNLESLQVVLATLQTLLLGPGFVVLYFHNVRERKQAEGAKKDACQYFVLSV